MKLLTKGQISFGKVAQLFNGNVDDCIAIDLIVQHIRDFLNNRNKREPPCSPVPSPARRHTTADGQFTRPH
ncbi:unnamed protein product [Timema podura]|uniref:Uncharacterized protein n=1 Tax=Timema podura TaxID=61482 RepID=A0ABN7NVT9_TIMPD|nr:unnamed protein product [Timema podura]